MFRQTILLISLIALVTAQSAYYSHGTRQDGDEYIETLFHQTELTETTSVHIVDVRVSDVNTTLTYVQYNVLEVRIFIFLLTLFLNFSCFRVLIQLTVMELDKLKLQIITQLN